jgi:hypothetical protein
VNVGPFLGETMGNPGFSAWFQLAVDLLTIPRSGGRRVC